MSIRSRSVKNSKIRGVVRHNTDGFPILSIHSNRRGRFGWVQPSLCSFLIGFECSERKAQFSHLGNTKNQLFQFFSKLPRHGPVSQCYRSIKSMQNSYFFLVTSIVHPTTRFGDWIQKSSNYAVRGLDQKVYTSVEATVCLCKCAHKGQRLSNILRHFKYF